jgi:hypothetical protein
VIRAAALAGAIAGCAFPTPSDELACETSADCAGDRMCDRGYCVLGGDIGNGAPDAAPAPDASLAELCADWHATHFEPCAIVPPLGPLVLTGANTYDTSAGVLHLPGGQLAPASQLLPTARLISVSSFSLAPGATLRVVGTRPLVIASWSTIDVGGVIDASSGANGDGAGANAPACATHAAQPGGDAGVGAGGGGGGGYGGAGGDGGTGDGADGGAGGAANAAAAELRGGCPGADGGAGDQPGGAGASGGGAIQLTARTAIAIDGTVHAGGSGGAGAIGTGGSGDGGGGGGGSGGRIGLDAATIAIGADAVLAANGGGGGAGAASAPGGRGSDGAANAASAPGGSGDAGAGGTGGAGSRPAGTPGAPSADHGAGGGGGGVGLIAIRGTPGMIPPTAVVSPAPTLTSE